MKIGVPVFLLILFLPELCAIASFLARRFRRRVARVPTNGMAGPDS